MLRLLLRLYPEAFRDRFADEIAADFEQGGSRWLDLLVSIRRERRAAGLAPVWPLAVGLLLATPIGYFDLHAKEVQGIVLLLLLGAGICGFAWPRRAWRWGLIFGASVPLWHLGLAAVGGASPYAVEPNVAATALAFVPAFLAAYLGAGLRLAVLPDGEVA